MIASLRLGAIIVAIAIPVAAHLEWLRVGLADALGASALLIAITESYIAWWKDHSSRQGSVLGLLPLLGTFVRAAFYSVRALIAAYIIVAGILGMVSYHQLDESVRAHSDPVVRSQAADFSTPIRVGILATLAGLLMVFATAFWEQRATRYAESRLGVLKDILAQVEQTLSENAGTSPDQTRNQAIDLALDGLVGALRLSVWQAVTSPLRLIRRHFATIRAVTYKLGPTGTALRIDRTSYPPDTPLGVLDIYKWLEANYEPALLDEARYRSACDDAKGAGEKGWRKRFHDYPDRHKFVSAAGWVMVRGEVRFRPLASTCEVFDDRTWHDIRSGRKHVKNKPANKQDFRWVEVRSYIGCPIKAGATTTGVLFVSGNVAGAFVPEDQEVVIAVATIIERIEAWHISKTQQWTTEPSASTGAPTTPLS